MTAAYGIAMPASRGVLSPVCYCTPAINFFNRLATQPTAARKVRYDALIKALMSASVWAKLDILYVFAAADQATALTNLVQSSYGGAIHGSVTFSADRGVTSDGSTGYIDAGFTPSTAGGQYALNSAAAGVWSLTAGAAAANTARSFGVSDGTENLSLTVRNGSNTIASIVNAVPVTGFANTLTDGLFAISRTSPSGWDVSRNASSFGTISQAAIGLPAMSLYLLALNSNGTLAGFDNKQLAIFFLGAGLSSTDTTNLYNALHAYLQAVAGVT